jgi:hypothetical protein
VRLNYSLSKESAGQLSEPLTRFRGIMSGVPVESDGHVPSDAAMGLQEDQPVL